MPANAETTPKQDRYRKVRAVAAAGTVLGVGAVITLAAWNDSEFAEGIFGAGSFAMESSHEGAEGHYASRGSAAEAAELSFNAVDLYPGEAVAAPLWVRLTADTSHPGVLHQITTAESGPAGGGDISAVDELSVEVYELGSGDTCSTGIEGSPVVSSSTLELETSEGQLDVDLMTGSGNDAGAAVQLCFVVEASEDLTRNATADVVWEIHGESVDN